MIEKYGVERIDEATVKQLKEIGFDEEMRAFLEAQEVSLDEVKAQMDACKDTDKLELLIGNIKKDREQAAMAAKELQAVPEAPAEAPAAEGEVQA